MGTTVARDSERSVDMMLLEGGKYPFPWSTLFKALEKIYITFALHPWYERQQVSDSQKFYEVCYSWHKIFFLKWKEFKYQKNLKEKNNWIFIFFYQIQWT